MLEVGWVVPITLDVGCCIFKAPNQFDVFGCGCDALKMPEIL